jgi:hypothetical protein
MGTPGLLAGLACVAVLGAAPAAAVGAGIFGASGERASFNCVACHTAGTVAPQVTVSGVVDGSPGDSLAVTVVVTRGEGSPGVAAGVGLATSSAGIFVDPDLALDDIRLDSGDVDNQVTHVRPKPYDVGGSATFSVLLTDLREGRHSLFVGANDTDVNLQVGNDRAVLLRVPFAVCDASAADDDGDGFTGLCDLCPAVFEAEQVDSDDLLVKLVTA